MKDWRDVLEYIYAEVGFPEPWPLSRELVALLLAVEVGRRR